MVPVVRGDDFEGSKSLELQNLEAFLVTKRNKILLMNDDFV